MSFNELLIVSSNVLKISNLNAGYQDLQVLQDVSLALERGRIGVLMGPNGAGKSTLLKAIFNLVQITSGSISFAGKDLVGLKTHELLSRGIAYVPQGKMNFGLLTVEENLLLGRGTSPLPAIEKIYQQFPVLKERRRELAFRLSGGQQQMLALGRALAITPQVLLLDEPSLGLAPRLVKEVFAHIQRINQEFGTTILIVEHNIRSVLDIADVGYVLLGGRVAGHGAAAELKTSPLFKKVFVGEFE